MYDIAEDQQMTPLDKPSPVPLFEQAVQQVAKNIQAPEDMVQFCALAAMSIAAQRLINVQLPEIGVVQTSLMLMVIAKSGERKSTVESKFFNAIREFEAEKRAAHEKDHNDWKIKHEAWQIERKALQKLFEKAVGKKESVEEIGSIRANLQRIISQESKEPSPAKILYDDSTAQALYRGLKNSLPFAGLVSSEGGSILKSGAFNDMAKLNSLWSGESITVDRISSESVQLNNARLTTLIMVQPEILDEFINKKGTQARGSGLMARFLFSSGKSTQGTRFINNDGYHRVFEHQELEHLENFNYLVKIFLERSYQATLKEKFEPQIIRLSPKAEKLWRDYHNYIEREIQEGGIYNEFSDHASKLAQNAGRIAALLNYFNLNDEFIRIEIMQYAIDLCQKLSRNFLTLFNVRPREIQDAEKLLAWIYDYTKNWHNATIKINDILQYGPPNLRKAAPLKAALNVLHDEGYIYFFKYINSRTEYICINLPRMPVL